MTKSNFMTIDEVNKKLDKGLEDVFKNERFQEMLHVMSKFRSYSLNNSLMIMIQKPNATMVKGYRGWQELGRHVNKGEKSIRILAPIIKKKEMEKINSVTQKPELDHKGQPKTEKKDVLVGFRPVSVFDVSQTNGKDIPNVRDFVNRDLENDESMKALYKDFFNYVNDHTSYELREDITEEGVGGYFNPKTNEIVVSTNTNKNESEKFRVLVHEFAHAKLHNLDGEYKDVSRQHKETQAECVAYTVSNYYGIETDDISLGYIATWSKDLNLARQSLGEIQKVSNEMIDVLDELQKEKIHEFYQDNSKEYESVSNFLANQFDVKLDSLNKDDPQLQFEILQKDRGNVLSARMEYSDKTDKFHVRLNNNRIIPLDDFDRGGNYTFLNKEIENGKLAESSQYHSATTYHISMSEDKKFVVEDDNQRTLSIKFDTSEQAERYLNRVELSQALHEQSFLKTQLDQKNVDLSVQDRLKTVNHQINYSVGKYLTHSTNKEFFPKANDGTVIGWTLMKRNNIQTLEDLKEYVNDTKHLPSNSDLRQAMDNAHEVDFDKESKLENVELE